jgi:hypothetical protein
MSRARAKPLTNELSELRVFRLGLLVLGALAWLTSLGANSVYQYFVTNIYA